MTDRGCLACLHRSHVLRCAHTSTNACLSLCKSRSPSQTDRAMLRLRRRIVCCKRPPSHSLLLPSRGLPPALAAAHWRRLRRGTGGARSLLASSPGPGQPGVCAAGRGPSPRPRRFQVQSCLHSQARPLHSPLPRHAHAPAGQCRPPQPSLGRYHALQARPGQRPSAWGSPGETGLPATSAFQSPGPRAGKVLRCGRRSRGAVHPRDTERQVPSSLSPLQFPSTPLPAGSVAASAAHRCAPGSTAWLTRLSGSTDSRRPGHPGLASPCLARPSLPATPDPSPPAYPPPCLTARVPPSATFTRPISEHPARHNLDALVHPHLPSATASLVAIPQSRRGLGSSPHGKETHRSARGRRDSSPVVAAALPDSLLSFGASSSRLIPRAPVASPELCGLTARLPRISAETRVDDEPPLVIVSPTVSRRGQRLLASPDALELIRADHVAWTALFLLA